MLPSFEPLRASSRLWNSRPSSRRAPVATMSLLSSRASRLSGPSSCLCALLALLLLTPPAPLASGESARHAGRTREARRPGHGDQLSRATGALTFSFFRSGPRRGGGERIALRVFIHHGHSPQNDRSSAGDRRGSPVLQGGSGVSSDPLSPWSQGRPTPWSLAPKTQGRRMHFFFF